MGKLRISRQRRVPVEGVVSTSYAVNNSNRNSELNCDSFAILLSQLIPENTKGFKTTQHRMTLTRGEVERVFLHMAEYLVDAHNPTRRHPEELLELAKGYLATSQEMGIIQAYCRPRRDAKGRLKVA